METIFQWSRIDNAPLSPSLSLIEFREHTGKWNIRDQIYITILIGKVEGTNKSVLHRISRNNQSNPILLLPSLSFSRRFVISRSRRRWPTDNRGPFSGLFHARTRAENVENVQEARPLPPLHPFPPKISHVSHAPFLALYIIYTPRRISIPSSLFPREKERKRGGGGETFIRWRLVPRRFRNPRRESIFRDTREPLLQRPLAGNFWGIKSVNDDDDDDDGRRNVKLESRNFIRFDSKTVPGYFAKNLAIYIT